MFTEQFAFSRPARVNFVGGGGKTGLILKLLEECSTTVPAVYTTTTRIHPPHTSGGLVIISSDNEDYLMQLLESAGLAWCSGRRFVVTHLPTSPRLLAGVTPDFAPRLDSLLFPLVFNEADGARSMSLKMPRGGEPVLMNGANYLVPVIGMDCLNKPAGAQTLFRWEIAARRCKLKTGDILTPELAAMILLHPQGVCRDWKLGMRIVPFINKADGAADDALAASLAASLFQNANFPVERVVFGSVENMRAQAISK